MRLQLGLGWTLRQVGRWLIDRRVVWALVGIQALALALRLWGLDWGLPYTYHPDESRYLSHVLVMLREGDLNPRWFLYPSLWVYLVLATQVFAFLRGVQMGVFVSTGDINLPTHPAIMGVGEADFPLFFLAARLLSTLAWLLVIAVAFGLASRIFGKRAGLVAALILAISPMAVEDSRYIRPDTVMVLFALLSVYFLIQYLDAGRPSSFLVAGLFCGFAVSCKLSMYVTVLVLVGGYLLRAWLHREELLRPVFVGGLLISALAFFAGTPFALLDYSSFVNGMTITVNAYLTGHPGADVQRAWLWNLGTLLRLEGPAPYLGIAAGCVWATWGFKTWIARLRVLVVALFPLFYHATLSSLEIGFPINLVPLLPFLAILCGGSCDWILSRTWDMPSSEGFRRVGGAAAIWLLILVVPVRNTVVQGVRLQTPDVRDTARQWISENISPGSRIVIESYGPTVDEKGLAVEYVGTLSGRSLGDYQLERVDYLVSSGYADRFVRLSDLYPREAARYETLFRALTLVQQVGNDAGGRIRIYLVPHAEVLVNQDEFGPIVGPIVGEEGGVRRVGQTFTIPVDGTITAIELVRMATWNRMNDRDVILHLLVEEDGALRETRTSVVNARHITNESALRFEFEPLDVPGGQEMLFVVESPSSTSENAVTVRHSARDSFADGHMVVNGVPQESDLAFRVIGAPY